MNIAVSTNDDYVNFTIVTLKSVIISNKDYDIDIYILYSDINCENKNKIEENFRGNNRVKIIFIRINPDNYTQLPLQERFTIEAYYRLQLQDVLPHNVDRILYLDSDIIVRKDIIDMYNVKFDDKYLAACAYAVVNPCKEFNSGVILFNIAMLRKNGINLEFYLNKAKKMKKNFYLDQAILNYVFKIDDILFLEKWKYNFTYGFYKRFKGELNKTEYNYNDIAIMHFPGPGFRPWQVKKEMFRWDYSNEKLTQIMKQFGYSFDEFYMKMIDEWWEVCKSTTVFQDIIDKLYPNMIYVMSDILNKIANSNDFKLGNNIMTLYRKIKK